MSDSREWEALQETNVSITQPRIDGSDLNTKRALL